MATIEFLGAAGTVTGSKFLVETAGRRLLVDCGLYQGLKELQLRNRERLPVDPASIDWPTTSVPGYRDRIAVD